MHFSRLQLNHWQQFESVDIDLHDNLTIITGANGSGKTTILDLFAKHSGWDRPSLSTPKTEEGTGIVKWFSRLFGGEDKSNESTIGEIRYSDDSLSKLTIPKSSSAQYHVEIPNKKNISCFYIPSHRAIFRYRALGNIPTTKKNKQNAFDEVANISRNRYLSDSSESASFLMKNTLIGWAINGYGVSSGQKTIMAKDTEQIQAFEGFQKALKKMLPTSLGFEELEIRNMEIVFVCNESKDEFLLETASGGISAIIDITWQIYMFSTKERTDFTVIIDEVENHLHPTMQRTILRDLVNTFPNARFIVSTHAPLIVGSVKNSSIYVLMYNESNKIVSKQLDFLQAAKTATEILDEVLGVSFTMPIWVEDELVKLVTEFESKGLSPDDFPLLRQRLKDMGLEKMLPYAIENLLEGRNND